MTTRFYLFAGCLYCFIFNINIAQAQDLITIYFSHERGFYNDSFDLVVSTEGDHVTTKYTIDGSEPNLLNGIGPFNTNFTLPDINRSTVVRVYAYNNEDTISKTHTYIFIDDVFTQNNNIVINQLKYPSQWGIGPIKSDNNICEQQPANYDMSMDSLNIPNYKQKLFDGLMEIPTMAISLDKNQIFGKDSGLYVYPLETDLACYTLPNNVNSWERKASIEIFNDNEQKSFQVNAGLKISGGSTRYFDFFKHSFKLKFRSKYGDRKLKYPLFGNQATKKIESLQLRMIGQCTPHDWNKARRSATQLHKDSWARHIQKKLSGYGSSATSKFFHLFINGLYWGVYDVSERPDAHFMATYYNGEPEDYDVIKIGEVKNGTNEAYNKMYDSAHSIYDTIYTENQAKVLEVNQARAKFVYDEIKDVLDVDKFLDYILLNTYLANNDWVTNNWIATRNFKQNGKFQFFVWDAEIILNDFGKSSASIINAGKRDASKKYHPIDLHQRLLDIPEYQIKFADNIQCRCLEEGGVLNQDSLMASYRKFKEKTQNAALLEFARWGNVRKSYPNYIPLSYNIIEETLQEYENEVFPFLVKELLQSYGNPHTYALFPTYYRKPYNKIYNFEAVKFAHLSGEVPNGYLLELNNTNTKLNENNQPISIGKIYYTTDGTDPRNLDDSIADNAIEYTGPIVIDKYKIIKARVFADTFNFEDFSPTGMKTFTINNFWSAMCPQEFFPKGYYDGIVINEIHYHPKPISDTISGNHLEFLELKNIGEKEIILTNVNFTKGIKYQFPKGSILASNDYILLALDSLAAKQHYKVKIDGQYYGKLDNGGELIELSRPDKVKIDAVDYNDDWDSRTDGKGASLSLRLDLAAKKNNHLEDSWAGSANENTAHVQNLFCTPIAFDFETYEPSCYGNNDGSINLNLSGGTGNLNIEWSDYSTSNKILNLIAGKYEVTVTDEQGCFVTKSITLTEPSPLNSNLEVIHASALDKPDGSASINLNNQTSNYNIVWSNESTNTINNNLMPGDNYWVDITNKNNAACSLIEHFSVEVASSCKMPNNFSAIPTSDNGIIVSWDGEDENEGYTLSYRIYNKENWDTVTSFLPSVLLTNLDACTYYQYKVTANCATNTSNTTAVKTFLTSGCRSLCNESAVVGEIINLTEESVFILWDIVPNAKYRLNFKRNGLSTWRQFETSNNFSLLYALTACTNFEWFVEVICPNGVINSSEIYNFTTAGCLKKMSVEKDNMAELNDSLDFKLYPNPAQNILKISSVYPKLATTHKVVIYDLTGRIVKNSQVFSEDIALNIENLQAGIYVAQITKNSQNLQYQFIKQ